MIRIHVKVVDYIVIAAILGCLVLAYSGFRIEAALLIIAVIIVASWRFWDKKRERDLMNSAGGRDNGPDHPDSIYCADNHSSDSSGDGGDGNND